MTIDATDLRETILTVLPRLPGDDDEDLWEHGIIDSLAVVELIEALEQRYGVRFAPEDLRKENFRSLACIRRTLGAVASGGPR